MGQARTAMMVMFFLASLAGPSQAQYGPVNRQTVGLFASDASERVKAVKRMGRLDRRAAPGTLDALEMVLARDPEPDVRLEVVEKLARAKSYKLRAMNVLIRVSETDQDPKVRERARTAVEYMARKGSVLPARGRLKKPVSQARFQPAMPAQNANPYQQAVPNANQYGVQQIPNQVPQQSTMNQYPVQHAARSRQYAGSQAYAQTQRPQVPQTPQVPYQQQPRMMPQASPAVANATAVPSQTQAATPAKRVPVTKLQPVEVAKEETKTTSPIKRFFFNEGSDTEKEVAVTKETVTKSPAMAKTTTPKISQAPPTPRALESKPAKPTIVDIPVAKKMTNPDVVPAARKELASTSESTDVVATAARIAAEKAPSEPEKDVKLVSLSRMFRFGRSSAKEEASTSSDSAKVTTASPKREESESKDHSEHKGLAAGLLGGRASSRPAEQRVAQAPTRQQSVSRKPSTTSAASSEKQTRRADRSAMSEKDRKQRAQRLLVEAREMIEQGQFKEAQRRIDLAREYAVRYGLFEETPNDVERDLQKAMSPSKDNPFPISF
ncbi:hypothetical protein Pan216_16960 [Planctomycetes bacterium Pan216]|uniref:HEAT repeat protein n=1 Tax=Kolteria novifilia TaxID=2527975 RepID=A0A518B1I6_9BACT|nr:hypothetical protein Pan216_16960 [Planctomycetes bacterium Pan216]